ncbi:MAG: DUF547 domain-containing protein [Gemmatimonadota bacterium]|nr:DUF547 domain-containing protein [Gemmatimonadota bacterium]
MPERKALLKLVILAAIIASAFFAAWKTGLYEYTDLSKAATAVRDLRDVRFIIPLFVLAYALAATFGLPGSILTLVGGAMFGFGLGTLLNWSGATAGAIAAYTLARTLGRDAFRGVLGKYGDKLDALAENKGFLAILRLRLIPAVPFNVLNYASGLAGVPARSYIAATALGIIPGTAIYTYFADALLAGAEGAQEKALLRLCIAGALLMLLSFVPAIARKFGVGTASAAVMALTLTTSPSEAQNAIADHSGFDAVLRTNVVNGLVDYDAFKRSPDFAAYLEAMAKVDPESLSDRDRLAFWINVYNAWTIQLINDKGERGSIRNINKSLGLLKLKGPWNEQLVRVRGKRLSLDDVEHRIIRKEWKEPRIHFALVCAAIGCPPLRTEAYTGDRLEAQLEDQGVLFLRRSPSKNRVDVANRTVHASMIFTLYKADFGGNDANVGKFIARWYPDGPEKQLLNSGKFRLSKTDYDWSLNSQARALERGVTTVNR